VSEHEAWPGEESSENVLAEAEAEPDAGDNEVEPAPEEPRLRVAHDHGAGDLDVPDDVDLLEGEPRSTRRGVGIVVGRAHTEIANALLTSALAELDAAGVAKDVVTVMAVPGAFELPLGAMALAKTRRYSCIVALGCVVRDETPEFEQIAGEAASGLQLAALETGVPVSFGVLTLDSATADGRAEKGAEAVRTALEMADLFSQLRATAQAQ
jgi:6,7-dimethyl-8-ribityllumazine synthase